MIRYVSQSGLLRSLSHTPYIHHLSSITHLTNIIIRPTLSIIQIEIPGVNNNYPAL